MPDEKCIPDPNKDCPGIHKAKDVEADVKALGQKLSDFQQTVADTNNRFGARIGRLEAREEVRNEQYKHIQEKMNDLAHDVAEFQREQKESIAELRREHKESMEELKRGNKDILDLVAPLRQKADNVEKLEKDVEELKGKPGKTWEDIKAKALGWTVALTEHFKNSGQLDEELVTSYCKQIAEEYQLPIPKMNNKYFAFASKSVAFAPIADVIAIVLIGGYIVIQSIFRISINDKIQSYGQLRTIGATQKQVTRIVKRERRKLGCIGIVIGTVLGVCGGFLLFSKGFNAVSYVTMVSLTLISCWIMVSISIRKPVKIAAGISPIEAVRFTPVQKNIRSREKNIKLNPVSMGIANFKRDRKKTISIIASLSLGGIILLVVSSLVLLRSERRRRPTGIFERWLPGEGLPRNVRLRSSTNRFPSTIGRSRFSLMLPMYLAFSAQAREIYTSYTDRVESFGLDECWPDATTVITPENYRERAWSLPVSDLLYVVPAAARKLHQYGITTIGELARANVDLLYWLLGKNGIMLHRFANGQDHSGVRRYYAVPPMKSIGNSTTAPRDLISEDDVKITLMALCESVGARLREQMCVCSTITVSIRDNRLLSYDRQTKLPQSTANTLDIWEAALELFRRHHASETPVRSFAVKAGGLSPAGEMEQLSLFPEEQKAQRRAAIDRTLDKLRGKYGYFCVRRGITLVDPALDLDAGEEHIIHPIGFLGTLHE